MWEKTSQTPTVLSEGVLPPRTRQSSHNYGTSFQGDSCTSPMVVTSREPRAGEAPSILGQNGHAGDRRIPRGIRGSLEGRDFSGNMERRVESLFHKSPRAHNNLTSSRALASYISRERNIPADDFVRQHVGGRLLQKSGGNAISSSERHGDENIGLVSKTLDIFRAG